MGGNSPRIFHTVWTKETKTFSRCSFTAIKNEENFIEWLYPSWAKALGNVSFFDYALYGGIDTPTHSNFFFFFLTYSAIPLQYTYPRSAYQARGAGFADSIFDILYPHSDVLLLYNDSSFVTTDKYLYNSILGKYISTFYMYIENINYQKQNQVMYIQQPVIPVHYVRVMRLALTFPE